MRSVGRLRDHADRVEARGDSVPFGEPGACNFHAAEASDRRAEHTTECSIAAGNVGARDATLLVGVRAEGNDDRSARDAMARLDAVTGGPDMRRVGAQVVVDDDAAGVTDTDARSPRKIAHWGAPQAR